MEEYQQFLNKLQKRGNNKHTVSHCLGARDAWKWVRTDKWKALNNKKCSASLYSSVINTVNSILAEKLLEGHEIVFPYNMGSVRLIQVPASIKLKEGKVTNNYRTDWKKTLEYWYSDKEARENKIRIKRVQKYLCSIQYCKQRARYRNQRFYSFRANRSLIRQLGRKIENSRLNTLMS